MKSARRVFLIIALVCVVVGTVLASTAFALANFDINALSTIPPKVQQHYVAKSSAQINAITFNGIEDDVQIRYADVENVELDYWQSTTTRGEFYRIDDKGTDGRLNVYCDPAWNLFGFNWVTEFHPVIITVPQNFEGSLVVRTVSGEVVVAQPRATLNHLEITTTSGDIDYDLLQVDNIRVATVSGAVDGKIAGAVTFANYSQVSNDLNLRYGSVQSFNAETVSGSIDVEVLENADDTYSFSTATLSGDINVPASAQAAKNTVSCKTVSGDIDFKRVPAFSD